MSKTLLPSALIAMSLCAGACTQELEYAGAFTLPHAGTISAPGQETPFSEAVAYVASLTGGQIRALGAESGRFLSDDQEASFLRGSPLATGQRRALNSIDIWSPTAEQLTVFAVDETYGVLLEIPHVTGVEDGVPVERRVEVSEVTASGGGALSDFTVHDGFASTETWTLTWDGSVWRAEGDRSGDLDGSIVPGEPYTPSAQPFTLTASAGDAPGDTMTFSTDSGLVEHDLGGSPIEVSTAPDQSLLAVIVQDDASDTGRVVWWDPATASETAEVSLPDGRRPTHLAWADSTLWITDATADVDLDGNLVSGALWRVELGQTEATRVDVAAPVATLEPVSSANRLYYVEVGGTDLHAIALDTGETVDLDPVRPGSTGFPFYGVVQGLAVLPGSFTEFDDTDDEAERTASDVIAVSLFRGTVVFYNPETGCLLQDGLGPRSTAVGRGSGSSAGDYEFDFDGDGGGPTLASNAANANHIVVNTCAGIARSESWRVIYDDVALAWEVEGEFSGVQENMAFEGVRYVSDNGEISFLIQPGSSPSQAGWLIQFSITEGSMGLTGDRDGDGTIDTLNNEFAWSVPGTPLPVVLPAAGTRESDTPAVIVPLQGNDLVARGRPDNGQTDAVWQ